MVNAVEKPKRKSSEDTIGKVLNKLAKVSPRKEGSAMFEFTRSRDEILSNVKYVVKTNLDPFDTATGSLPFGRIVEYYGLDGSGKTAMAVRSCVKAKHGEIYEIMPDGSHVKLDPEKVKFEVTVLYIDNEQSLDSGDRLVVDGVEIEAVVGRVDTVDQLFKACDETIKVLDALEAETGVLQFLVIVVDTISSTMSSEELTDAWGKKDYPRHAAQLKQGFRKMAREINKHNVLMICVNQVGDSFKQKAHGKFNNSSYPQESDFSSFGGKALRYYASLRVFFYNYGEYKEHPGTKFPTGLKIYFYVKKNRQVKPLRSGMLVLSFEGGYNVAYSLLEHLVYLKFAIPAMGIYELRFSQNGIDVGNVASLQDQDEGRRRTKNPKVPRQSWITFYQENSSIVQQLWDKAAHYMFAVETLEDDLDGVEQDSDSNEPNIDIEE